MPSENKYVKHIKLDFYLVKTIKHLIENWHKEYTGIVACSLTDGDKIAFATSTKNGKNWLHAERNAYLKFKDIYGEPSKNAIFISTLSPCNKNLKYRAEASCAKFIKNLGIKRIHFGIIDPLHVNSLSSYANMGFIPSITQNENVATICKNLLDLFEKYNSRINIELSLIKQELGDSFFNSFLTNFENEE